MFKQWSDTKFLEVSNYSTITEGCITDASPGGSHPALSELRGLVPSQTCHLVDNSDWCVRVHHTNNKYNGLHCLLTVVSLDGSAVVCSFILHEQLDIIPLDEQLFSGSPNAISLKTVWRERPVLQPHSLPLWHG